MCYSKLNIFYIDDIDIKYIIDYIDGTISI